MSIKEYSAKFFRALKRDGLTATLSKAFHYSKGMMQQKNLTEKDIPQLTNVYDKLLAWQEAKEIHSIAIVPSGFVFDELYNQRTINLAKFLSQKGYGVIYVPWQWYDGEVLEKNYDEVYKHTFQVPLFDFLRGKRQLERTSIFKKKTFFITFPARLFYDVAKAMKEMDYSIVYDMMDEWEEFKKEGQASWYERQVEEDTIALADVVTAVSKPLSEKFAYVREDIHVIGNGYFPELLGEKHISLTKPATDGKIHIGYVGHLTESWYHWDLLFQAADLLPEAMFHIIGYGLSEEMEQKVNAHPSMTFYGKIPPNELHHHVRKWHLGMIPFKITTLSKAVDPIKIYDYLYFGLPTIVTGIPHLATYPMVHYCKTAEEFANACKKAYENVIGERYNKQEIKDFEEATTWTSRFEEMLELEEKAKNLRS